MGTGNFFESFTCHFHGCVKASGEFLHPFGHLYIEQVGLLLTLQEIVSRLFLWSPSGLGLCLAFCLRCRLSLGCTLWLCCSLTLGCIKFALRFGLALGTGLAFGFRLWHLFIRALSRGSWACWSTLGICVCFLSILGTWTSHTTSFFLCWFNMNFLCFLCFLQNFPLGTDFLFLSIPFGTSALFFLCETLPSAFVLLPLVAFFSRSCWSRVTGVMSSSFTAVLLPVLSSSIDFLTLVTFFSTWPSSVLSSWAGWALGWIWIIYAWL